MAADSSKIVKNSAKPPAAGKGRPKGAKNKTTTIMKEAMIAVYDDLQKDADPKKPHAHFIQWAKANDTEFYKLASKLLPIQLTGDDGEDIKVAHSIELIGVAASAKD